MRTLLLPLGLAALWLSPPVASAQSATAPLPHVARLTLEQAQDLAAAHSPDLSAARREVEASDGGVQQARALRNPELNATVEDTRAATRTTTTTLGFPIELGGKRAARAAELVGKRVSAGKSSPVDATRARVDAANAQLEVADARAALQSARQALAASWGAAEPHFDDVAGDVGAAPARPDVAELLRQVDAAPALVAGQLEIDRRAALVGVERSKAVPDVLVSVGAKRDNELGRTQAVVGVSIPLPLFDRNEGAVLEASRRADKARDEASATRLRVVAEVNQAATRLAAARASLQVLRETVLPAAQQARDAATTGFEAGKFGFLDVIDAQRSLLQARARTLNTLAAAHEAAATIDRLLGR
jgi:cobalt-zinc-cadmium efflux system outer membrane protein